MANDPAYKIRNSRVLIDPINNEKIRCQEKLFSQKGFGWAGRQTKSFAARQKLKILKPYIEFIETIYDTVIIV
jgi:hypothetical protein